MIIGLCGNLGAGKTLGLSILTRIAHQDGYKVFTNYQIFGYPNTLVKQHVDLKNVPLGSNWFAMDEFWIDLDSRASFSNKLLTRSIVQVRKRHITLACTSQSWDQYDKRLRRVTSLLLFPETVMDPLGYPAGVMYYYTKNTKMEIDDNEAIRGLPYFALPNVIDGFNVCENYDTDEVMEESKNEIETRADQLLEKYCSFEGKKTELTALLQFEESMNKSQASDVAQYIIIKNKMEYSA